MEQEIISLLTQRIADLSQQVGDVKTAVEENGRVWGVPTPAFYATFGVVASLLPAWLLDRARSQRERKAVRGAILAEISAIATTIRQRGYVSFLKRAMREPGRMARIKVPDDYFMVYRGNLDKIGLLPRHEASRILSFYHDVQSVIQDVTEGGVLYEGGASTVAFLEAIDLLQSALNTADEFGVVQRHQTGSHGSEHAA